MCVTSHQAASLPFSGPRCLQLLLTWGMLLPLWPDGSRQSLKRWCVGLTFPGILLLLLLQETTDTYQWPCECEPPLVKPGVSSHYPDQTAKAQRAGAIGSRSHHSFQGGMSRCTDLLVMSLFRSGAPFHSEGGRGTSTTSAPSSLPSPT